MVKKPGIVKDPTDEASLKSDVQAFASGLGLASAGGNGFHDADFRPGAGKELQPKPSLPDKKSKSEAKPKAAQPGLGGGKKGLGKQSSNTTDGHQQLPQKDSNNAASKPAQRMRVPGGGGQNQLPNVRERDWNAGVGSRPEGVASLLGRNEPSLWYEAAAALGRCSSSGDEGPVAPDKIQQLQQQGEGALENEARLFDRDIGKRNPADARWLQQVRRSGTTNDRVAALTLTLQESAVANLKAFDELLGWVEKRKGGRAVVPKAIEALKEICVAALLPERKLMFLSDQPLAAIGSSKDDQRRLLFWYFEDSLKRRYAAFVRALDECSRDNLEIMKEKAMRAMADLLASRPEQEAALLTSLVNKLGDPSRKLASKAGYLLAGLLAQHPGMKMIVAREVERFMFRPGLQERARYYCAVFLNQLVLSHDPAQGGSQLAEKLVDIYFTTFRLILEGRIGQKVQQAHVKHAKLPPDRRAKLDKAAARAKAKGTDTKQAASTPEVTLVYLAPLIAGVRRAFPFVAPDRVEPLVEAHAPALFRIVHVAPFGVAVQALLLLLQLMSTRSAINDRFYRALYSVMLSGEAGRSTKTPMFLSLLFKAMQADVSIKRQAAFAKRLLQVAVEQPAPFASGCLILLSELMKGKPALWDAIQQPEEHGDDVEAFEDAPDSDAEEASKSNGLGLPALGATAASLLYDMQKREPAFCGAERSAWWELTALAAHAHPSVAAMAKSMLAGTNVSYQGDPLRDLTLTAFLDKFMQKKPKVQRAAGTSLMQPLEKKSAAAVTSAELGSAAFAALAEASVAPENIFFHKFYQVQTARGKVPGKKRKRDEEAAGGDSDASSGSEAEIDEVMDMEEDMEDTGGQDTSNSAYDYANLAAAMDDGDAVLDQDGDGEADAVVSDEEDEEDLNPFELPSGTSSDELDDDGNAADHGPAGGIANVATLDGATFSDMSSDDDDEDDDSIQEADLDGDDGFIEDAADQSSHLRKLKSSRKKPSGTKADFASIEDYASLIDEDEGGAQADPAASRHGSEGSRSKAQKPREAPSASVPKSKSLQQGQGGLSTASQSGIGRKLKRSSKSRQSQRQDS